MSIRPHNIGSTIDAVDLFCGVGGSSIGIQAAGAELIAAANHSQYAIDVHSANVPTAEHFRADLLDRSADCYVHPHDLPPARFLWASPSCKHHSPANATKLYASAPAHHQPSLFADYLDALQGDSGAAHHLSERSRTTMVCPWLYADKHRPDIVIVENVVEVTRWGPNRDGSQFRDWLWQWDKIGYEHECVFINSGFFPPCPQSRDRIYVVFWRRGNPRPDLEHRPQAWCESCGELTTAAQWWKPRKPTWPLPRWGKYGAQYMYRCLGCNGTVVPLRVPAAAAIDWTDLGPTIGERPRPLAQRTIDRIKRGLAKFADWPPVVIAGGQALVIPNRINARAHHQTEQIPTIVAGANHMYLASNGVILPAAGNTSERPGQTRARGLWEQLFAQTGTLEHGTASLPLMVDLRDGGSIQSGQRPVTSPLSTITSGGSHHGLATTGFAKFNGGPSDTAWHGPLDQLGAVTGRDTTGLLSMTMPLLHANSGDRYRHAALEQLATLTTARERYLASLTQHEDLASIDDEELAAKVRFRMLTPDPELRFGMGFDHTFHLFGTKTQMTMGLGNAVTPPPATWLTERALASLDDRTAPRRLEAA